MKTNYTAKLNKIYETAKAIVAIGKCPTCNAALKRNLSMTGWYQCEQLGADNFRKDASKHSCSFQCFTA